VLHLEAELTEDLLRHVERALCHEVHAHALRPDEPRDLLDLVDERLRRVVEQKVSLVEEQYELRLLGVADLGEFLEEFGEEPQQKRRIYARRFAQQARRVEHTHDTVPREVDAHQVVERKRRFAEEAVRALLIEHEQLTLNGAHRRRTHVAVLRAQLARILTHPRQQRAQILQIEQQQSFIVGDPKRGEKHARLRFIESEEIAEDERPHLGERRAHRVSLLTVDVPEDRRAGTRCELRQWDQPEPALDLWTWTPGCGDAREVSFHVCREHRHAGLREPLRQDLQRDGLSGSGGAGHQPVAVTHREQLFDELATIAADDDGTTHVVDILRNPDRPQP
jgi:hypothetical protein